MLTKYVTYDINPDGSSMGPLLDLLRELDAKKITGSTWMIEAKVKLEELCQKLEKATKPGDHVFVLHKGGKGVRHRAVR